MIKSPKRDGPGRTLLLPKTKSDGVEETEPVVCVEQKSSGASPSCSAPPAGWGKRCDCTVWAACEVTANGCQAGLLTAGISGGLHHFKS